MPDIPGSPLGYAGVLFLIAGFFLILAGLNVVKVEKVTVTPGVMTTIIGGLVALIGMVSLIFEMQLQIPVTVVTPTPEVNASGQVTTTDGTFDSPTEIPSPIPPTPTPTPQIEEATPIIATPSIEITQTAPVETTALTLPEIHASVDVFDTNHHGWFVGPYEVTGIDSTAEVANGAYRISVRSFEPDQVWRYFFSRANDFWMAVDVRITESSNPEISPSVGLFFRNSGSEDTLSYYEIGFRTDGNYRIRYYHNQTYNLIHDWTPSDLFDFQDGRNNRFGVSAHGDDFIVYSNGEELLRFDDETISEEGLIGLGVHLPDSMSINVEFDNLEVINLGTEEQVIFENFEDNRNAWGTEESESDLALILPQIVDGKYLLEIQSKESLFFRNRVFTAKNFWLGVDTRFISSTASPDLNLVGVSLRETDDIYYLFEIRQDGNYRLREYRDGMPEFLVEDSPTDAIKQNLEEVNRLGVLALDDQIQFYINGIPVHTLNGANITESGLIGLTGSVLSGGQTFIADFDNFELVTYPDVIED